MTTNPAVTRLPSVLSFEGTDIHIIDREGHPWVPAADLSRALGYAGADAVSHLYQRNIDEHLYQRNIDEFTDDMSLTFNMTVNGYGVGGPEKPVRIFSPRGCYLVAMLAKTTKAKAFRKWVLDVLDKPVELEEPGNRQDDGDGMSITAAVKFHAARLHVTLTGLRWRLRSRFKVRSIRDLSPIERANAIIWLASLTMDDFTGAYRKLIDEPQGFADAEAARERMSFDEAVRAVNMPGRRLSFEPMAEPAGPLVTLTFAVPASAAAEICALVARLSAPISTTTGQGE